MNKGIEIAPCKEIDVFIGSSGYLFIDLFKSDGNDEPDYTFGLEPLALVQEFIVDHWNPEANRIETQESEAVSDLIDTLKRCVTLLENALYDDRHPDE